MKLFYIVDWQPIMLQFKVLHNFTEESFIGISSENLRSTAMLPDLQEPKNTAIQGEQKEYKIMLIAIN